MIFLSKLVTPHEYNMKLMRGLEPSMKYQPGASVEQWREEARAKLIELTGLDKFAKCDLKFNIESQIQNDKFLNIRFTYQSEEGFTVPGHFCIPNEKKSEKLPVVICVQGHSRGMHISIGSIKYEKDFEHITQTDHAYALQAIDRGYCAMVIEQRNFGEAGGTPDPNCYCSTMAALLIGRTTVAERVWDVMRAIDVIEENFSVADTSKIALTGNSGGGTTTFYAGCLEDRLNTVMPSCAVCTYDDSIANIHHCSCNFVPHIREYFNMGDLALLIAPKKYIIVAGKNDRIFPIDAVKKTYELTKEMYEYAGVPDNCAFVIGDGPHRYYADDCWPVFDRLSGFSK